MSYCGQNKIPTREIEKDDLHRAGLGEKEVEFHNLEIGAEAFRDLIYDKFPPLRSGGRFEFLKCTPNTRTLEVLSPVTLSSPLALKIELVYGHYNKTWRCLSYLIYLVEYVN